MKHLLRYNLRSLHNDEPEGRAKIQAWQGEEEEGAEREREEERHKEISSLSTNTGDVQKICLKPIK